MNTNEYLKDQLTVWQQGNPPVPPGYEKYGAPDEIGIFYGLAAKGSPLRFAPEDLSPYQAVAFDETEKVAIDVLRLQGSAHHSMDMVALYSETGESQGVEWHKFFMQFSKRTVRDVPVRYGDVTFSGVIHPETGLFVCSPWERELALSALTFVAARNPHQIYRVSENGWPLRDRP